MKMFSFILKMYLSMCPNFGKVTNFVVLSEEN